MSHITNCPRCHGDLSAASFTERGLVCPHCQNPLAGTGIAGLNASQVDTDVTRGPHPATVLLGVLIALNAGGIAALFFFTQRALVFALRCLLLFGVLDVLVIAVVLPPLWRRYTRWLRSRGNDEITVGFGLLLLSVVAIAAVVIVFFSACYGLLTLKG